MLSKRSSWEAQACVSAGTSISDAECWALLNASAPPRVSVEGLGGDGVTP